MSQPGTKRQRTESPSPGSPYASPRLRRRSNSQLPEDLPPVESGSRGGRPSSSAGGGPSSGSGSVAQSIFGGGGGSGSGAGAGPSTSTVAPFTSLPPPPSLHSQMQTSGGPPPPALPSHPRLPTSQTLPSLQSATGWTSSTSFAAGPSGAYDQPMSLRTRMEERESSEGSTIATRDSGRERQPRSMMACIRCRKQKMKCDGPAAAPCRGCRAANVTCVFETRSRQRPKSISGLATLQPLPAVMTTTGGMQAPIFATTSRSGLDPYHLGGQVVSPPPPTRRRDSLVAQSPLGPPPPPAGPSTGPPPPTASVSATSPSPRLQSGISGYPGPGPSPSQTVTTPRAAHSGSSRPGPSGSGLGPPFPTNPLFSSQSIRPMSPMAAPPPVSTDSRIRQLESSVRALEPLHARYNTLQGAIARLESQQDSLIATVRSLTPASAIQISPTRSIPGASASRPTVNLSEQAWDVYRSYICPLTPWLAMLSSPVGLSGEVVACLTARVDPNVKDVDSASGRRVRAEIGRLYAQGVRFSDSDLSALGVFATWDADDALICSTVGQARAAGKHRTLEKGSMRDARAWSELLVLEHLTHAPDFLPCLTNAPVADAWRTRISGREPTSPASRDRDIKLLAWLEYAELMAETQHAITEDAHHPAAAETPSEARPATAGSTRQSIGGSEPSPTVETAPRERRKSKRMELLSRWDGWNAQWGGSGDPILSIHFHYAVLFTTSPLTYSDSATTWQSLARETAGYEQLEKARDAAIDVIRGICSPEIARTLSYSFPIFRSRLALAVAHLVAHMTFIPHSPITPIPHIQSILRLAYERLGGGQPSQWPATTTPPVLGTILVEIVESGNVAAVGKREVVGRELGRDLWSRLVGGGS